MKASIAIQVLPLIEGDEKICEIVDEVIAYIETLDLKYEVGPFETTIEGESLEELMNIATECIQIANRAGGDKIAAYMKLFYAPEKNILSIDDKIDKYRK
ncbi:MAG: thiamine-binding protein [Tissierellia bacterium]|nr:thiamine-binding protein [Tissierellia bacterium]